MKKRNGETFQGHSFSLSPVPLLQNNLAGLRAGLARLAQCLYARVIGDGQARRFHF